MVDAVASRADVGAMPEKIMPSALPRKPASFTFAAFLVMCFATCGLIGLFANFATPVPLYRLAAREAALDDVARALTGPDPQAAIEALRPKLDESADVLLPLRADMGSVIAAERAAMRVRMLADAHAVSQRMIVMITTITAMAAIFGIAMLGLSRR
jgi:hypothetical protein